MQKAFQKKYLYFLTFLIALLGIENSLAKNVKVIKEKAGFSVSKKNISKDKKLNINTIDASTLAKVKGVGKKKATAIIDCRNKNGKFKDLEGLLKVKSRGINKNWLNKVSVFLSV